MRYWRVFWLCVVAVLVLAGLVGCGAGFADDAYYRLREVPIGLLPSAWILGAVLFLLLVAPAMTDDRAPAYGVGCLALVLALLTVPYAVHQSIYAERSDERGRVEIEGYALVAENRWGVGPSSSSAPECRVYLRQDGGLFSREVPVTQPSNCPGMRVSEDGTAFVLAPGRAGVPREVDPAQHF